MRLIDADALLQKRCHAGAFATQPEVYVIGQGYVMDAPTIEPVVRGKWHRITHSFERVQRFNCSVCGAQSNTRKHNFCPNCGADMREEPKC